ncbi:MAG: tetratricopeptide repeat protein [Candidatus Acidiferrales bacterium]
MLARCLAVFLACQVSFAVSASAQETKRSDGTNSDLTVHVRAPDGAPLNVPAIVQLFRFDGTPHGRTTAQGITPVVFSNLGPGSYYVEVSAPGFQTTREDASVVSSTAEVDVYMRPELSAPPTPAPPGPPVLAPKARKEMEQGLEALRTNDLKEARKRLDRAVALAPGHPDVLYLLGVLYVKLNDLPHAQSTLEKATQLDPNHPRALAALGTVLSNEGEYAKAIPLLRRAVEISDHAWETLWTLASAEYQERQFEQARDHAQESLKLAQDKAPEIRLLLAQALASLGEQEKAAQELESFLRSYPDHGQAPQAQLWLAKLQQQGR